MQADAPCGVAGDVARGGAGSPRVVVEAFSTGFEVPKVTEQFGAGPTPVDVYVSDSADPSVKVEFGPFGCSSEVWTTLAGLEALVGRLQAALVRARIARERTP